MKYTYTEEEKEKFCTFCKAKVNPPTCKGCPLYCPSSIYN